jgi:hypothetical protein
MAEAHRGHHAVVTGRGPLRVPGALLSSKTATSDAVGRKPLDASADPTDHRGHRRRIVNLNESDDFEAVLPIHSHVPASAARCR